MASQAPEKIDQSIRQVATQLYEIGVAAHAHANRLEDRTALSRRAQDLTRLLQTISSQTAETLKALPPQLPYEPGHRTIDQEDVPATDATFITPDIVEYIDTGRNPSIYTREFVEATSQLNLHMRGKQEAFTNFRDILVEEISMKMPDLKQDLQAIVEATSLET